MGGEPEDAVGDHPLVRRAAGIGRDPARAAVCLMFTASLPDYDWRDADGQKRIVAEHFAGVGWRAPAGQADRQHRHAAGLPAL